MIGYLPAARLGDMTAHGGVIVLKFFLHISKKEQKRRLLERLNEPHKHWKFSAADVKERQFCCSSR